jgi:phage FluMu protein Com
MGKSQKIACPICGKLVRARGLQGHIRLKHPPTTSTLVINLIDPGEHPKEIEVLESNSNDDLGPIPNSSDDLSSNANSSESISQPPHYTGLAGLEADRLSFVPTVLGYIQHYKKHPTAAENEWKKLSDLRKKYSWVEFSLRYKALSRIFGKKRHK